MLTLIIQLQWYVSGFSKTTPHPFTLGRKPWSCSQQWKLHPTSLKAEFLYKLLGIFLQWKFVSSSYLFIDLLISVWTHGYLCRYNYVIIPTIFYFITQIVQVLETLSNGSFVPLMLSVEYHQIIFHKCFTLVYSHQ